MELRKGITEFRRVDDPPLPSIDLRAFRSHCHAAARMLGGHVAFPVYPSGGGVANFTVAAVHLPGGAVTVLLNLNFPVVGFARPWCDERPSGPLVFVDCKPLADAFNDHGGYEVIGPAELDQPVRPGNLHLLSPAETEQVEYWKPTRIGDIVFNVWD